MASWEMRNHTLLPPVCRASPFYYPTRNMYMDPESPEAQTILRFYGLTYDEVMFYEVHHQIGKYVSRLVLMDET